MVRWPGWPPTSWAGRWWTGEVRREFGGCRGGGACRGSNGCRGGGGSRGGGGRRGWRGGVGRRYPGVPMSIAAELPAPAWDHIRTGRRPEPESVARVAEVDVATEGGGGAAARRGALQAGLPGAGALG